MSTENVTYYDVLGVKFDATSEEIRKAYKKSLRQTHPDTGGNEGLFRLVQIAWENLGDEQKRKIYDSSLKLGTILVSDLPNSPQATPPSSSASEGDSAFTYPQEQPKQYGKKSPTRTTKKTWGDLDYELVKTKGKVSSAVVIIWYGFTVIAFIGGYTWGAFYFWELWNADNSNGIAGVFALVVAIIPGVIAGIAGMGSAAILIVSLKVSFFLYKITKYFQK